MAITDDATDVALSSPLPKLSNSFLGAVETKRRLASSVFSFIFFQIARRLGDRVRRPCRRHLPFPPSSSDACSGLDEIRTAKRLILVNSVWNSSKWQDERKLKTNLSRCDFCPLRPGRACSCAPRDNPQSLITQVQMQRACSARNP